MESASLRILHGLPLDGNELGIAAFLPSDGDKEETDEIRELKKRIQAHPDYVRHDFETMVIHRLNGPIPLQWTVWR